MEDTIYAVGLFGNWRKVEKDLFGEVSQTRCIFVPRVVERAAETYPKARFFRYNGFMAYPITTREFEHEFFSHDEAGEDELEMAEPDPYKPMSDVEAKVAVGLGIGALVGGLIAVFMSGRKKKS